MTIYKKIKASIRILLISVMCSSALQVQAQSIANFLRLKEKNTGSNEVTLNPGASTAAYNLFFPTTVPTQGSVLAVSSLTGANALLSWTAPSTFAWGLTGNSGTTATTHFLGTTDNVGLRLKTNNLDRLTITETGYVGIGVTQPVSQLSNSITSITGTDALGSPIFTMINNNSGTWAGSFYSNVPGNGLNVKVKETTASTIAFQVGAGTTAQQNNVGGAGSTSLFNVLGNGNVGISTVAPANKLEITHGTTGNSGLRFTNLTSANTANTTSSKVLGLNSSGDVILTNVPGSQNIVEFAVNVNPNTAGTTFSPNTPSDQTVIYQSVIDNNMWTYNGTTYVTHVPSASTEFYLAGTTNDAGSNKTSAIWRNGSVGIGATSPSEKLTITASGGTTANLGIYSAPAAVPPSSDVVNAQINLGPSKDWFATIRNVLPTGSVGIDLSDIQITTGQGSNNNTQVPRFTVKAISGNVGVGTTSPGSKLEVNGSATNTTAFNAAAATTIDFSKSNLAYTSANAGAFTLSNIKDGGTYTLAVRGTVVGTASFAATGFVFKSINNGPTTSGKESLYTFVVMGTTVYFYMATGF